MSNVDTKLATYEARGFRIEEERREKAEDMKELRKEMSSAGLSKAEVAGVMLAIRRKFESADKAAARTEAEAIADMLGASGTAPLFGAAA